MCWRLLPRTKASIKRLLDGLQDQPLASFGPTQAWAQLQQESFNQTLRLMLRKGEVQRLVAPLRPASSAP